MSNTVATIIILIMPFTYFLTITEQGVTLVLLSNTFIILEPDSGENTNPTACLQVNVEHPLGRDVMFEFELSNLTTATLGVDFLPNETSSFLTIPGSFSGEFFRCLVVTVFGDDQFESDEIVVYEFRALSPLDSVFSPVLHISIIDNDQGTGQLHQWGYMHLCSNA